MAVPTGFSDAVVLEKFSRLYMCIVAQFDLFVQSVHGIVCEVSVQRSRLDNGERYVTAALLTTHSIFSPLR